MSLSELLQIQVPVPSLVSPLPFESAVSHPPPGPMLVGITLIARLQTELESPKSEDHVQKYLLLLQGEDWGWANASP